MSVVYFDYINLRNKNLLQNVGSAKSRFADSSFRLLEAGGMYESNAINVTPTFNDDDFEAIFGKEDEINDVSNEPSENDSLRLVIFYQFLACFNRR